MTSDPPTSADLPVASDLSMAADMPAVTHLVSVAGLTAERPERPAGAPGQASGLRAAVRLSGWRAVALGPVGWPFAVYSASRILLLLVAWAVAAIRHEPLAQEPFLFDGQWYLRLAEHGYPSAPLHTRSTLGFLPLYPLVLRAVAWLCVIGIPQSALATSLVGGLAAALLAHRLATAWWGEPAGRAATLVFCLFPGSVVFSMAYSECLTVPLALGCLLALRSQRWAAAGILAALAGAVEPVALVLIPACLVAAAAQVRDRGWRDPVTRRSLAAPLLAPLGIGGFAVFLWVWTGTPFAAYLAQHYGWHQQGEPLALLALPIAQHLISHPARLVPRIFAFNIWNGVIGGVFLALSIRALLRVRHELSAGTLVLTTGVAMVTLWSVLTPPNARMTLVAFPAVLVWGRRLSGRRLAVFAAAEALVLVVASALTFSGHMLPLHAATCRPPSRPSGTREGHRRPASLHRRSERAVRQSGTEHAGGQAPVGQGPPPGPAQAARSNRRSRPRPSHAGPQTWGLRVVDEVRPHARPLQLWCKVPAGLTVPRSPSSPVGTSPALAQAGSLPCARPPDR